MISPSGGEKYRLVRQIGSGGMGVVYEAWDLRLERRVAVKFLHPHLTSSEGNAARMEREARNAARVEHPNVVRVYGMETVDGQLVIEMQFIEGAPLHTILAAGKLSVGMAANLLRQFLEALDACHGHGVIHCDLKPGNLLVTPQGHLYLTDFGISQSVRSGGDAQSPGSSALWGTPRYIAPEALRGEQPDPRWDLYSAGAVIHEVLCGTPFQDWTTPDAARNSELRDSVPSIAALMPELSPQLACLIKALTARDPRRRPASAQAALVLLRDTPELKLSDGDVGRFASVFKTVETAEQTTKFAGKIPTRVGRVRRVALVAGLSAASVIAALFFVWQGQRESANHTGGERVPSPATTSTVPVVAPAPSVPKILESALVLTSAGVHFAYDDGIHGRELWAYLHATREMRLFADIVPGAGSSNPRRFLRRGVDEFLFAATTPETGEELWVALLEPSGETRDLRQVMDILPGPMSSEPYPLALMLTAVLFDAKTLAHGYELWCTNTDAAQTAMVADLVPGPLDSVPNHTRLSVDSGGTYMVAFGFDGMRLWRFDLASNAVRELAKVDSDTELIHVGENLLAFNNRDTEHGMEPWLYDPAKPGIHLLADIRPGAGSSDPGNLFAWKKLGIFRARTEEHGMELWCTDGTEAGTRQLMDINPGPEDGNPYGWVDAGNYLYFRARDSAHGDELWVTDGTPEGTRLAADTWAGPDSGTPYNIAAQPPFVYFSAKDGVHGEELWMLEIGKTDAAARLVADLWPGADGSEPINLQWWGSDYGVFTAKTGPDHTQLVLIKLANGNASLYPVPLPHDLP